MSRDDGTITGELRGLLADVNWTEIIDHVAILDSDWLDSWHAAADHACDAIDAVHANLERENESLRRELDRVLGEQDDRDWWVRLPVDADGVPIRVGDVMKGEKVGGGFCEPFEVVGYIMSNGELEPIDEHKLPRKRKYLHHHEPTVEDVLREFADIVRKERVELATIGEDTIAEFAAKLRLAGDVS